jgi:hypothetical protein
MFLPRPIRVAIAAYDGVFPSWIIIDTASEEHGHPPPERKGRTVCRCLNSRCCSRQTVPRL